jgi:hypothetical protein
MAFVEIKDVAFGGHLPTVPITELKQCRDCGLAWVPKRKQLVQA